jgi:hypothetical protein
MRILFFLLIFGIHLGVSAQITWETPRTIPTPYSKYIRTCKIDRGPAAGDILLTYSDRQHGGNIWMIRSSDLALTWSDPVRLLQSPKISDGEYIFNANIIQLQDDRLMLCYQHRWDPGTIATKSYTGIRYSSDGGYTWSDEQKTPNTCVWEARPIQVHNDKNGDGHNDIYIYYTQEVNPTFYRPEHCNQQYSVGRAVAYIVSYDNGVTWQTNSSERFSGRIIHRNYNGQPDSQGGMPTMVELPNHRIAVVAEAPKGNSIAFASWVTASDPYDYDFDNIQGDWCSVNYNVNINQANYDGDGYVIPSSVTLIPDLNVYPNNPINLWKMSNVYGNAPFTCVLPNGRIAYSQNSNQKIRVFVADVNGKNSVEVARPFSNTYNTFYSCIIPISENMVLVTAHDYDDCSQIHINRGTIIKDSSSPTTPGRPEITGIDGNIYTLEWTKSYDNLIVSHYEVWNNNDLLATTRWDNFIKIDTQAMSEYNIRIRAHDYQGNYSLFSQTLNFVTGLSEKTYRSLTVYPSITHDLVRINHEGIEHATVYLISMLGNIIDLKVAQNGTVNFSDFAPGIYQIVVSVGSIRYTAKIIKQ